MALAKTKAEKLSSISRLKEALLAYSNEMNNTRYADKPPLEQELEDIFNTHFTHLEKLYRVIEGNEPEHEHTKVEKLAQTMQKAANALRTCESPISDESAEDLNEMLGLLTIVDKVKDSKRKHKLKDAITDQLL